MEEVAKRRGIIEGSSRVLRELLRAPRVRKSIEILVGNLDPESAPLLVRAVMDDRKQFLDVLSATPKLANAASGAARSLAEGLLAFPDPLLRDYASHALDTLDAEGLGEAAGALAVLGRRLLKEAEGSAGGQLDRLAGEARSGFRAALARAGHDEAEILDGAVEALADRIRRTAREDRDLRRRVVQPLAEAWRDALEEDRARTGDDDAR